VALELKAADMLQQLLVDLLEFFMALGHISFKIAMVKP
jgi:hypothetical protein